MRQPAGGCPWSSLEELDEAKLEVALGLNLTACFWLTQAAIPHLRARGGGRILITSSVTGPRARRIDHIGSTAVAGLDALPPIVRAVKGKMSVLVDGGVRRGVDAIKGVALGAEGVMLGRATLYGACAAGEAGAARAIQILRDELVRAMQLSGVRSVAEIGPDLLAPPM